MQILITMKPVECLTMIVLQVLTTAKSIKACRWPLPRRPAEVQQSCFEYRKTCRFSNSCFEYCNACWGHVEVLQAGFECPISCWRTRYSASLFWLPQYMLNAPLYTFCLPRNLFNAVEDGPTRLASSPARAKNGEAPEHAVCACV